MMLSIVVGTALLSVIVVLLASLVLKHDRWTKELNIRLEKLEDRFYHPENYKEAFFRPTGKKKDNAKES